MLAHYVGTAERKIIRTNESNEKGNWKQKPGQRKQLTKKEKEKRNKEPVLNKIGMTL